MHFIKGTQCDLTSWLMAQIPGSVLGSDTKFSPPIGQVISGAFTLQSKQWQ